jgi:hypothetical protein
VNSKRVEKSSYKNLCLMNQSTLLCQRSGGFKSSDGSISELILDPPHLTPLPRFDEDYGRERQQQLEYYLHALLSNRHLMSQSKVLRQFLGLIDDSTSHSLLKELFKRRRDEYYERMELEASSAQAREAEHTLQENSLWIEKNPHLQLQSSSSAFEDASLDGGSSFAESPLSHLTDSVSSMAMYFENKIGYPHLKKAISNPFMEGEEVTAPQRNPSVAAAAAVALGDQFSDDEEDDDEDEDMIWLGTGDSSSQEEGSLGERQQEQQREKEQEEQEGSISPEKRSSYRERISHNIKRRTQYRESILLQFSGLDEEDSGEDSNFSSSSAHTSTPPSPTSSVAKHLWESFMSLLQSISKSSSSSSDTLTLTQSIEIVPIVILAVVVYLVSSGIGSENHIRR